MKHIAILLLTVFITRAFALADCDLCQKMHEVERKMDKVKPDPVNPETIEKQDKIIWESSKLLVEALKREELPKDLARSTIRLAIRVLPYDNGMMTVSDNIGQFKKHYQADKKTSLQQVLNKMVSEGAVTEKEKQVLLESYGLNKKKTPQSGQ